ncbi:hypothetical protein N9C85_01050 [Synechococcus sp. AH-224-I15]|nr:hypothetical protein [Synechococcus sp. AH-224-I15]
MQFLSYDLSAALERSARNIAPAIAFVITCWVFVRDAANSFDDWWIHQWCGFDRPAVEPAPAQIHISAADLLPLDSFNVHELRVLCRQRIGSDVRPGGRGLYQSRRADLISLLEGN